MSQRASIQKAKLGVNDEIAHTVIISETDSEDYTLWLRVKEIVIDGDSVFYRCAFPDGSMMRSLIPESTVTRWRSDADFDNPIDLSPDHLASRLFTLFCQAETPENAAHYKAGLEFYYTVIGD